LHTFQSYWQHIVFSHKVIAKTVFLPRIFARESGDEIFRLRASGEVRLLQNKIGKAGR